MRNVVVLICGVLSVGFALAASTPIQSSPDVFAAAPERPSPAVQNGLADSYRDAAQPGGGMLELLSGSKAGLREVYEVAINDTVPGKEAPYQLAKEVQAPAASSAAKSSDAGSTQKSKEETPSGLYREGAMSINVYGGGFRSFWDRKETIGWGTMAFEYFLRHDVSINGELCGYYVGQVYDRDSAGAGFNIVGRWHPLISQDKRLAMYFEAGLGLVDFDHRTPGPAGTDFNFTIQSGFGARVHVTDKISVLVGPRYLHISNAGVVGGRGRNPSDNDVGGIAGISLRF